MSIGYGASGVGTPFQICLGLLLEGRAFDAPHSGGSVLQHLLGTATLLETWDQDEVTVLSGLLHSIVDDDGSMSDRPDIIQRLSDAAGTEVFRTVVFYKHRAETSLYNDTRDDRAIVLSEREASRLAHIVSANALDQISRLSADAYLEPAMIERLAPRLNGIARQAVLNAHAAS